MLDGFVERSLCPLTIGWSELSLFFLSLRARDWKPPSSALAAFGLRLLLLCM